MGKPDRPENAVSVFVERMTRFELATLTLANVMGGVRTVRLLRCSTSQSVKPSVQSACSVDSVERHPSELQSFIASARLLVGLG